MTMDGDRLVARARSEPTNEPKAARRLARGEGEQDDGCVDESDVVETTHEDAEGLDDEEVDGEGDEMVLSRDEFAMLQAFHRLVPLPALRSKIIRVLCDEDLQVADDDHESEAPAALPSARFALNEPHAMVEKAPPPLTGGAGYLTDSLVKHSPLTRRLSKHTATKRSSSLLRPHRAVDLAAHTPRIKPSSGSARIDGGDARVG